MKQLFIFFELILLDLAKIKPWGLIIWFVNQVVRDLEYLFQVNPPSSAVVSCQRESRSP